MGEAGKAVRCRSRASGWSSLCHMGLVSTCWLWAAAACRPLFRTRFAQSKPLQTSLRTGATEGRAAGDPRRGEFPPPPFGGWAGIAPRRTHGLLRCTVGYTPPPHVGGWACIARPPAAPAALAAGGPGDGLASGLPGRPALATPGRRGHPPDEDNGRGRFRGAGGGRPPDRLWQCDPTNRLGDSKSPPDAGANGNREHDM